MTAIKNNNTIIIRNTERQSENVFFNKIVIFSKISNKKQKKSENYCFHSVSFLLFILFFLLTH